MKDNERLVPRFPVFHVPHDGRLVKSRLQMFCIPKEKVWFYHEKMRDKAVAVLIPPECRTEGEIAIFPFSRLQCDTGRYKGSEEVMEKYGMGYSYSRAYDGTLINENPGARWELLRYYDRFHGYMNALCNGHPRVFLIDLHSYHDEIIPKDFLVPGRKTPDLCIGTDLRFTPPEVLWIVQKHFREAGFTTDINYPYSGCYIPARIASGEIERDFIVVMLEFHRRAYLTAEEDLDEEKIEKIRQAIRKVIEECNGIQWGKRKAGQGRNPDL